MRLTEAQSAAVPVLAAVLACLKQGWFCFLTRNEWNTVGPALNAKGAGWVACHIGGGLAVFADQSPGVTEPFGLTAPGPGLALAFWTTLPVTDRLEASHDLADKIGVGLDTAAVFAQKVAEVATLRTVIDKITERVQAATADKTAA